MRSAVVCSASPAASPSVTSGAFSPVAASSVKSTVARHIEARVDYVHDEPAVRALCRQGGVAFLMPPFEKSDLFKGIVMGGVLPRKTFSMGHAEEKRYYMECRNILGEE